MATGGQVMKWMMALFTSVDGICFLLLALVFLWLSFCLAFRWRCEGLVFLLRSRTGAWTVRALGCTASFCLGLSLCWVVYLNMASQYYANEMKVNKPVLGTAPASVAVLVQDSQVD